MCSVLVVRGVQPPSGGQQLDLRPLRDTSFDLVEHRDDACTVGCDGRQPDDGATVQLEFAHLRDAELETSGAARQPGVAPLTASV